MYYKKSVCFIVILAVVLYGTTTKEWNKKSESRENKATQDERIRQELQCFPVPISTIDASMRVTFENSWMLERNYGGKRGHEGCDLMSSAKEMGRFPVLSMTDGKVTNLGWNDKGGWRIGIESDSGTYYYYAHLSMYAVLAEGDRVAPGELLGFMGNSGYGKEGTTGKFPVHLHVGIYIEKKGKREAVNPYPFLKEIQSKKIRYHFQ